MMDKARIDYLALVQKGEFLHRIMASGVAFRDVYELQQTLRDGEDWYPFWAGNGKAYETQGEHAHANAHIRETGACYLLAALCWHYAGCLHFHNLDERARAQTEKVRLYRRAGECFIPHARPVAIPYENVELPGYLRLPVAVAAPPCVIFLSGSDSTKEEFHTLENLFLAAGVATLGIDGPGQGEAWERMKLRPDFETAVSASIDWLERRGGVDPARIGVLGKSFGGHLAVRAAALEPRLRCAVWLGGFFDTAHYNWDEPLRRLRFQVFCGTDQVDEARAMAAQFDLSDVASRVRCPLLVVHSRLDRTSPPDHAERLVEQAGSHATLVMYEEGYHCCPNLAATVYPKMVDWMVGRL